MARVEYIKKYLIKIRKPLQVLIYINLLISSHMHLLNHKMECIVQPIWRDLKLQKENTTKLG